MTSEHRAWIFLLIFWLAAGSSAAAGIRLEFADPATGDDRELSDYLLESRCLNDLIGRLTAHFRLPAEVVLRMGTRDGPLYDVGSRTIRMPFDLGFVPASTDPRLDMVERRLLYSGAVVFAVSHEVGHALIDLYRWPVRGTREEEEAADAIAVYLVLHVAGGRDAVMHALAEMVRIERVREDAGEANPCMRTDRAGRVFCWFAGADPADSAWFWKLNLIPERTPDDCRARYLEFERRLAALLKPAERATDEDRR